jgi:hypothetical protein
LGGRFQSEKGRKKERGMKKGRKECPKWRIDVVLVDSKSWNGHGRGEQQCAEVVTASMWMHNLYKRRYR